MNRIRYSLSFLLLAGVACVHAQQPIVKINGGSLQSGCDVTAAPGAPIFQLDATGNVLVNGTLNPVGCGAAPVGGGTPNFGVNPPASGVVINGGSATVVAGTVTNVPFTYQAYNASQGCSVGTPTTTGTCPAITASSGSCSGSGSQYSCAPTGATLSIPTVAQMVGNTNCAYSVKATCMPNSITSSATLTVVANAQQGGPCTSLAPIATGGSGNWTRVLTTAVKFGDGKVNAGIDATDYVKVWSYTPTAPVAWPGGYGLTTRPSASVNQYFAEGFTVPTDGSVTGHPNWTISGSGQNGNASYTISSCPGDFGQAGTQLTTGCSVNIGSGTLTAVVANSQTGSYCSLKPGNTYYLNILPMAPLPVGNTSTSTCNGTCLPWLGVFQ